MTMREEYDDTVAGKRLSPESLMMGYGYRPEWSEGALKIPIFQTSTFTFRNAAEGKRYFEIAHGAVDAEDGETGGLIYSRLNNPDLEILEDRLTLWDNAERALAFSSGMAAISTALLSYLRPGDVLLHTAPLYGGTDELIRGILPTLGVTCVEWESGMSRAQIDALLDGAEGDAALRMIFMETPANPTNDLFDIEMARQIADHHSPQDRPALVAVDNTFLGPLWQHPLVHGADLVVYSATKYIGGHSDLIAGAVLGSAEAIAPIAAMRTLLGSMATPWTGWLIMRSLETLSLRMHRQAQNAGRVATFLSEHPKVRRVSYLGLLEAGDPQHDLYKRQCLAPGAMISFEVDGGEAAAARFVDSLSLIHLAVSLGSTESLVEIPATMTHMGVPADEKERFGVTPSLVRLSVGVENPDDLILDIGEALKAV
jgi:methionine-gamma-lyase